MSLIVFPFKDEDPNVLAANLAAAATHDRVREVWGVAAGVGASFSHARNAARDIATAHGTPVEVFAQERIGYLRPGKGDGMNTAIRRAVARGFERIHFYDADITNFDGGWIDGAEQGADRGYEIVRHRFPRASTDAMITWMITRPSLAMLFPGTLLPRLGQPLGGELAISGRVAEQLAEDRHVLARSDWGIDTMITHATSRMEVPIYEHNVVEGKRHSLYGSLEELRPMVIECLDAVCSLRGRPGPAADSTFAADPSAAVPGDLKHTLAYEIEPTLGLLGAGWTDEEVELAGTLPGGLAGDVLRNQDQPHFDSMDADRWGVALAWLHEEFRPDTPAMGNLAFRLWLMRVLAYTTRQALEGYEAAIDYLERTIASYEKVAST